MFGRRDGTHAARRRCSNLFENERRRGFVSAKHYAHRRRRALAEQYSAEKYLMSRQLTTSCDLL